MSRNAGMSIEKIDAEDCLTIKQVQEVELEILKSFSDFCDAHNLCYFLAYGTLLGAKRHGGFIPWDDDVDVWMPRRDYELLRSYSKIGKYRVLFPENDDSLWLFAKIVDPETVVCEPELRDISSYGLFIDIFPLDGMKDIKRTKRSKRIIKPLRTLYRCGYVYDYSKKHRRKFDYTAKRILSVVSRLRPSQWYKRRISEIATKYEYTASDHVVSLASAAPLENEVFPIRCFSDYEFIDFEGCQFRAPLDSEAILEIMYGDNWRIPIVRPQHVFAKKRQY